MAEIYQGLVLLAAGMGIVYVFLTALIIVTQFACKGLARFDHIFPKEAPKKTSVKAAGNDDENVALAIAVALNA